MSSNIQEYFGSMVFNDDAMQTGLPKIIYKTLKKTIEDGEPLDTNLANAVAHAMKEWALEKGCTHFTHWFQPMTGITAGKHDSFINKNEFGKPIIEFSGKELIKGEPDASSFPSGGIRATFEARGYTTWDPTSYAFAKDGTLYIPTAFMSYTGQSLDKKTPLLRSMERLNIEALKLLHILGKTDVKHVFTTVGAEQEYFLIDRKVYNLRKDLIFTGRTLFGAESPKGQQLEDHYFGSIKTRVSKFMSDLDTELWKLGIYAKTKHNEVAPSQHEMAPIYTITNIAADQNQLTMTVMKQIAERHGLVCLLHEKPFAGINGSGKHNNWSISTNTGENLLSPDKNPHGNIQFLLFLSAVIKAVNEYQDLLRLSVASASNDHRLGAHEAPPAIISIYLGSELEAVIESITSDTDYINQEKLKMDLGVDVLPDFKKDTTDRNRTSPFAFTGNKFEFRMLGSSLNISCPNIILNTIVADALAQFADKLSGAADLNSAAIALIKETLESNKQIIFNGNNYSPKWEAEAEKRGLLNLKTSPEAFIKYLDKKNIQLFERNKIYTQEEVTARYEIITESYIKHLNIEASTMLDIARKDILPAVSFYIRDIANTALAKKALSDKIPADVEINLVQKLSGLLSCFANKINELECALNSAAEYENNIQKLAEYYTDPVLATMNELRAIADEMEINTASSYWPMPSYGELLFSV